MSYAIPKLKLALAKQALIHFFRCSQQTHDEIEFLQNFCSMNDTDKILKLKTRLLVEENNDMLVAAVLADSSPEEFIFLRDKYLFDHSFVQVSMKLNVHTNGLQRWRDKFLGQIASLLEYRLPVDDIFSRNKVEALIFVLERTIVFYEEYGHADTAVLNSLKAKLNIYQNLLFAINIFLVSDSQDISYRTIKTKILNHNLPLADLERLIGTSHTTILHYLRLFQEQFYYFN